METFHLRYEILTAFDLAWPWSTVVEVKIDILPTNNDLLIKKAFIYPQHFWLALKCLCNKELLSCVHM